MASDDVKVTIFYKWWFKPAVYVSCVGALPFVPFIGIDRSLNIIKPALDWIARNGAYVK